MNETMVTMIGNVASMVQYGQTAGGIPMANFRLASTERRYDRARAEWVDGDTLWVTVLAWRGLASNVVSSLEKGDPVLVSGRLRVREWEDEGKRRSVVEIDARAIGHDLGRGTSAFRSSVRGRSELAGVQPAGEAVPEWIAQAVRERRALGGQASLAGAVGERVAGEPVGWAGVIGQGPRRRGSCRWARWRWARRRSSRPPRRWRAPGGGRLPCWSVWWRARGGSSWRRRRCPGWPMVRRSERCRWLTWLRPPDGESGRR